MLNRSLACLLALALGLGPMVADTIEWAPSYDLARVAQLLVLGLAALGLWRERFSASTGLLAGLALGITLSLVPVVLAARPLWALREWALLASLGLLAWRVAVPVAGASAWRASAWVAAVAAPHALVALGLALVAVGAGGSLQPHALLPGFENPRMYNHAQTVMLPFLALAVVEERRLWRLLAAGGLVACATLLWLTGGRATMVALLVALSLWLTWGKPGRRLAAVLGAALAVGSALAWGLLQAGTTTVGDYAMQRLASDQSRLLLWHEAWQAWAQSPLWGVGPMHLAQGGHAKAGHPHNFYLQVLAEWGWPVALAFVAGLAWVGRVAWRATRHATQQGDTAAVSNIAYLGIAAAVLVDAAFSGSWVMPYSQTWIAVAFGLLWQRTRRQSLLTGRTVSARGFLVVPAMLWALSAPQILTLPDHLAQALQQFPSERWHPRFWSHGHFE